MKDVALPDFISSMTATQLLVCQTNGRSRNGEPHLLSTALNAFRDRQCADHNNLIVETPINQRQSAPLRCTSGAQK